MSQSALSPDHIHVSKLALQIPVGTSRWLKPSAETSPQPIVVSVSIPVSLRRAGVSDSVGDTLNYGTVCKAITKATKRPGGFSCAEELAECIADASFATFDAVYEMIVRVEKPHGLLHADCAGVEIVRRRGASSGADKLFVENLAVGCIIGIHPWERTNTQIVRLYLEMECAGGVNQWKSAPGSAGFDHHGAASAVYDHVLKSSYQTVETLVAAIAGVILEFAPSSVISKVHVRLAKPSALMFATAGVSITRSHEDYPATLTLQPADYGDKHVAALGMGSNLGDSVGHIEQALRELEKELGLRVLDTSFMYQSKPMYVEDQPDFVNCACLIETTLSPIALIALLKRIEVSVGRTPTIRNGPRVVDLDILFYDDIIMDNTAEVKEGELHLIIPHMRVNEREFVLRPLADMIPDHIHPILKQPIRILLAALMSTTSPSLTKIVPFPAPLSSPSSSPSPSPSPPFPPTNLPLHSRTYLMSTLNATPDSFSDGGVLDSADLPVASLALSNLIDVGGYSTRPNAAYVSPAEELRRVLPVLRAIREDHKLGMPVSIDTFRPAVAREALRHGATCVNDVRALEGEGAGEGGRAAMADVLREFAVPVVMMHSRGDAGANKDYSAFGGDVVEGVRAELGEKMRWALGPGKGGLRRWNVIVDPGIGFSKTVEDNTRLIRELRRLTAPPTGGATTLTFTDLRALLDVENDALRTHPLTGMPVLLGTSRKSFLGKLMLREEPEKADERGYATAVAITAGIAQGADIMRVHDVMEMRDAVRVADAMYRPRASS